MRPIRLMLAWLLAASVLAGAAAQTASAKSRLSFAVRYERIGMTLTRLEVTNLTPRADLRVSIVCPVGQPCPAGFTVAHVSGKVELAPLVGKKLPAGTRITVRASHGALAAKASLTLPH